MSLSEFYNDDWPKRAKMCKECTGGKCCYPGCNEKAAHAHHVRYRDEIGPVKGREMIGQDIVPLCEKHHDLDTRSHPDGAHNPKNYIKSKNYLDSRNTKAYFEQLMCGLNEKLLSEYRQECFLEFINIPSNSYSQF